MRRLVGAALLSAALAQAALAQGTPPPLDTLRDVQQAIRKCWRWPPLSAVHEGMELTVQLSFKRDGEIFGAHVTYQSPGVSNDERYAYYRALVRAIARCTPLHLSPALGEAIAGRPFYFRFRDTRKQKEA